MAPDEPAHGEEGAMGGYGGSQEDQPISGGSANQQEAVNPGDMLRVQNAYSHAANFTSGGNGGASSTEGTAGKINPAVLQEQAAAAYGMNGPAARSILSKDLRSQALMIRGAANAADETVSRYQSRRIR